MTRQELELRIKAQNDFLDKVKDGKIQYINPETNEIEHELKVEKFQLQAIQESKVKLESELAKLKD